MSKHSDYQLLPVAYCGNCSCLATDDYVLLSQGANYWNHEVQCWSCISYHHLQHTECRIFLKDVGTSLSNAFLSALVKGIWKLVCIDSDWVIDLNKIMMACSASAFYLKVFVLKLIWFVKDILESQPDWSRTHLKMGYNGPTKQIIRETICGHEP